MCCYTCWLCLGLGGRGQIPGCSRVFVEVPGRNPTSHLQVDVVCIRNLELLCVYPPDTLLPSDFHRGCALDCCYSPCSLRNTGPAVIWLQNRLSNSALSKAGRFAKPDICSTQKSFKFTQQRIFKLPSRLVTSTVVCYCRTTLPSAGTSDLYHCSLYGRR